MKLQFKHQKFQADAARAVCDVFTGQPFATHSYMVDPGQAVNGQGELFKESGFANELLTGYLTPEVMLSRIQKMQRDQQIKPSDTLVGPGINLTIEMETGVGKTYTYIMEVNKTKRQNSPTLKNSQKFVKWGQWFNTRSNSEKIINFEITDFSMYGDFLPKIDARFL